MQAATENGESDASNADGHGKTDSSETKNTDAAVSPSSDVPGTAESSANGAESDDAISLLKVKRLLRSFGEPITLFGETNAQRVERLKAIQQRRAELYVSPTFLVLAVFPSCFRFCLLCGYSSTMCSPQSTRFSTHTDTLIHPPILLLFILSLSLPFSLSSLSFAVTSDPWVRRTSC